MTTVADNQALENEVLEALHPLPTEAGEARATTTREVALAMLSRCAQTIDSTTELIQEAGSLAATTLEVDLFAVGETVSESEKLLVEVASPSNHRQEQVSELPHRADRSVLSFAIHERRPIVLADLAADRRFSDRLLSHQQVTSGIVCPISYGEHDYGALGVFTRDERAFSKDDVLFVQSLTLLLGPAIAQQHTQQALEQQTQLLESTLESLESIFLLLDSSGAIVRVNRACFDVSGFRLRDISHRSFAGAFLLPEEAPLIQDAITRLRAGDQGVRCETYLLTKGGDRRRVSWSFSLPDLRLATSDMIIVNGIDITEQHEALAKLGRLDTALREYREGEVANRPGQQVALPGPDETLRDSQEVEEQRSHRRRAYPYIQAIGPCRDGKLPELLEFYEVRCRDISPRGFSFMTPEPPDFLELVVTFGSPPSQLFLRARIVHVTPILHEGRNVLLIGCEYIDRVESVEQA